MSAGRLNSEGHATGTSETTVRAQVREIAALLATAYLRLQRAGRIPGTAQDGRAQGQDVADRRPGRRRDPQGMAPGPQAESP